MKKNKSKQKIFSIDELTSECGYFFCGNANNGYCCKHPLQEEKYDGEGCCFSWSCPLGYQADEEDFKDKSVDKNGWDEWEENEFVVCEVDENGKFIGEAQGEDQ